MSAATPQPTENCVAAGIWALSSSLNASGSSFGFGGKLGLAPPVSSSSSVLASQRAEVCGGDAHAGARRNTTTANPLVVARWTGCPGSV